MQAGVFHHRAPCSALAWEICGKERLWGIPHHPCPAWGSPKNPSHAASAAWVRSEWDMGMRGTIFGATTATHCPVLCPQGHTLSCSCDQEFAHIGVSIQAGQGLPCI